MTILGIETSCDETALALLEAHGQGDNFECRVIASLVHSQAELHSAYGGVFPTLAKREHGKNIVPLLHKLFLEAGIISGPREPVSGSAEPTPASRTPSRPPKASLEPLIIPALEQFRAEIAPQNPELWEAMTHAGFLQDKPPIDAIAVTEGPGLEPALWVGINCARMLGAIWGVPVMSIDHMEGHIVGSLLPSDATNGAWQKLHPLPLPAVAFLISGGHTQLIKEEKLGEYEIVGETRDDAVGEAFDKAARLLGLPYPGGPHLSALAGKAVEEGIEAPLKLPRPMLDSGDLDFSFSGLKTAVLYATRSAPRDASGTLTDNFRKGLAREFEDAVTETLDTKLRAALEEVGAKSIIIGGGVSANNALRRKFEETATEYSLPIFLPSRHISGDNALMIALAGALKCENRPETNAPGVSLRAQGTKRLGMQD